jgi:cytochrome c-type biogenesis protein CcmH/NrfG
LGNAYCVQKNYTDAITAFKKAIQYDSYNAAALYNLGNAYYMCG